MEMLSGQSQPSIENDSAAVAEKIKLFTIENREGTKLLVSNYGATVQSLFVKDRYGKTGDIVLGYDDINDYIKDEFYIGAVVGRYCNRLSQSKVSIEGKDPFYVTVNEKGFHLHGGAEGYNKKIFSATKFSATGKNGVSFKYTSPDMEEGFPGTLELEVIYTLDDNNDWTIEYKATTDKATILNLTQHSYFNLSGNPAAGVLDHELQVPAKWYLPVNAQQVPTGELATVTNTPFDFTVFKQIGKDAGEVNEQLQLSGGYDHSFVLEQQHSTRLKHAASVKHEPSGRQMDVYSTEPAVHFYAGNFLAGVKGKNGITYQKHAGLCMETQHFPDSPNKPHFPSTQLNPGENFYSKTVFKFSAE